ncbi:hypothetical protein NADFUDRAFT_82593 [Nadsonia fulvescens var. elongata DSM 6958]|uniref:Heat shock transcription factor n=1 Tax=Nadsonia fulvescens var. elongata DSM 6958 TaxID=857566 RepID=A0A1E3PJE9_9ASCO|nr:hypothetical protein NADFUDRAFT_82593 [Nadsonia fulvescens var. elongata DSM 6958]
MSPPKYPLLHNSDESTSMALSAISHSVNSSSSLSSDLQPLPPLSTSVLPIHSNIGPPGPEFKEIIPGKSTATLRKQLSERKLLTKHKRTGGSSGTAGLTNGAASSSTTTSSAKKIRPAFVMKLWTMVNDTKNSQFIQWAPDGQSFQVTGREPFEKNVLPKYFKHSNFSSFVRQLNMYGWHKVQDVTAGAMQSNDETWQFKSPNFIRGRDDLLENIVRNKGPKGSDDEEDSELNLLLDELEIIKHNQSTITEELNRIRKDNELLWTENYQQRERHRAHTETLDKIMRFLASLYSNPAKILSDIQQQNGKQQRLLLQHATNDISNKNSSNDNSFSNKSSSGATHTSNGIVGTNNLSEAGSNNFSPIFSNSSFSNVQPIMELGDEPTNSEDLNSGDFNADFNQLFPPSIQLDSASHNNDFNNYNNYNDNENSIGNLSTLSTPHGRIQSISSATSPLDVSPKTNPNEEAVLTVGSTLSNATPLSARNKNLDHQPSVNDLLSLVPGADNGISSGTGTSSESPPQLPVTSAGNPMANGNIEMPPSELANSNLALELVNTPRLSFFPDLGDYGHNGNTMNNGMTTNSSDNANTNSSLSLESLGSLIPNNTPTSTPVNASINNNMNNNNNNKNALLNDDLNIVPSMSIEELTKTINDQGHSIQHIQELLNRVQVRPSISPSSSSPSLTNINSNGEAPVKIDNTNDTNNNNIAISNSNNLGLNNDDASFDVNDFLINPGPSTEDYFDNIDQAVAPGATYTSSSVVDAIINGTEGDNPLINTSMEPQPVIKRRRVGLD